MKSFTVNKTFNQNRLTDELIEAGVAVIGMRGTGGDVLGIFTSGQVITTDASVDATVNAVIAAHNDTPTLEEKLRDIPQLAKVLAACVEALARIKVNSPAALNGMPGWAVDQLTTAYQFNKNQGV